MTPFKKIVICGVGLIGGSFALALKKSGFKGKILGLERSPDILERAHALGIVDEPGLSLEETLRDADLIVLSVPVAQTGNALKMILPYWHDGLIVSDTGSTKTDVVAMARDVLGEKIAQFIPAHPIAGSEMNGPEAAVDDLFVGKKAVIAALPENSRADVERLADVWERCGAIIHHLTPENHDTVFGTVSHMPHLLAYGLVDYVANHPKSDLFFQYAASGFRDFTRIAGSSPEMWRDITLANRKQLLVELDAYLKEIELIRDLVDKADGCGLEKIYTNAQEARMNWLNAIENPEKKKMN
ncbi:prephenate dehydrogenase/arogenate dehydrogenase family protein [uncultured Oxalobacter sp.]|uniref:prephenate dehydrogenase n=1 Tax=uncultured Oxalobacter sp. TaxID=337245 RepID=UPI002596ED5C|nr:prephenate dehydrogenase/arogenate dehydrogenase family protein [uncultured Oxalobacter sp.]